LVALADNYGDKGLKILAFPSNQFGGQEPGSHEDILAFVGNEFGATQDKIVFFSKADVNGVSARSLFSFLTERLPGDGGGRDIEWNFSKFLVDHKGNLYKRFSPRQSPVPDMIRDIETLLMKRNDK